MFLITSLTIYVNRLILHLSLSTFPNCNLVIFFKFSYNIFHGSFGIVILLYFQFNYISFTIKNKISHESGTTTLTSSFKLRITTATQYIKKGLFNTLPIFKREKKKRIYAFQNQTTINWSNFDCRKFKKMTITVILSMEL